MYRLIFLSAAVYHHYKLNRTRQQAQCRHKRFCQTVFDLPPVLILRPLFRTFLLDCLAFHVPVLFCFLPYQPMPAVQTDKRVMYVRPARLRIARAILGIRYAIQPKRFTARPCGFDRLRTQTDIVQKTCASDLSKFRRRNIDQHDHSSSCMISIHSAHMIATFFVARTLIPHIGHTYLRVDELLTFMPFLSGSR